MATVRDFTVERLDNARPHEEVKTIVRLVDCGREKLIQIDTYGRPDREIPSKVSQTIRLDEAAFEKLVQIGKSHF